MTGKELIDQTLNEENGWHFEDFTINCYFESGQLPHFHFKNKRVEGCIRLDVPRYFCHQPQHDGLNSKEKKTIINFLKNDGWEEMAMIWNKQATVKIECERPDYTQLPNLNPSTGKLNKEDRR